MAISHYFKLASSNKPNMTYQMGEKVYQNKDPWHGASLKADNY